MTGSQLFAWWKLLRTAALAAGLLLSFMALVEVLRVYLILRDFHPALGIFFLTTIAAGVFWLAFRFLSAVWNLPRAPTPPEILDRTNPTERELLAYGRFLQHRMLQLRDNPNLGEAEKDKLADLLTQLPSTLGDNPAAETITQAETSLAVAFNPVDQIAEKEVAECVRDVMLGVVLSPYRSADLLIVLYKNGHMILRLAQLYHTRPEPIEQIRILRDVLSIVATVNFLNFTEKFFERLLERVPLLGQVAGDLTQGMGAGLLTSAAGHAAIERCRNLRGWDRKAEQQRLDQRMSQFARDVGRIYEGDISPKLRSRLPDFTIVSAKISAAFDGTVESMSNWIWLPVSQRGAVVASATARVGTVAWRGVRKGTLKIGERGKSLLDRETSRISRLGGRIAEGGSKARQRLPWNRRKQLPGPPEAS